MADADSTKPFNAPLDPAAGVWRYLDFPKFVSLLDNRALWFSRVDMLGDPFEGSTPKGDLAFWESVRGQFPEKSWIADHNESSIRNMVRWSRTLTYANCWHLNEHESAAMWHQYARESASIAIHTTYARLRAALPGHIDVGMVKYIDYESSPIPSGNILNYFMHKRRSFEHEKELRALIWGLSHDRLTGQPHWPIKSDLPGISVPVDVGALVDDVVLGPQCPAWVEALVRSLVERYDLNLAVKRSSMEAEPLL
jgi:hypothetical protein